MSTLNPIRFDAPPLNPSPNGLFAVTNWQVDAAYRFMNSGVEIKGPNYGGDGAFGVWAVPGCGMVLLVTVEGSGDSTTWTFTFEGQTTTALTKTTTASEFEDAIEALSNVSPGQVVVAQPTSPGPFIVSLAKRGDYSTTVTGVNLDVDSQHIKKYGERPDILDPFEPMTVWAYDECDLTKPSRDEVSKRAAQILRLEEQVAIEEEFANRLLTDVGTPENVANIVEAISYLEGALARTNTVGFIHAGATWAAYAAQAQLISKSGTKLVTPLGHTLVLGGGYIDGLGDTLVATSQPYGWRTEAETRTAIDERANLFSAIAERTVAVGYEAVIDAATIT